MSRILSGTQAVSHRPLVSMIAGLVSLAAVAACGATADTSASTASTQEQALTEAQSSYSDAKLAGEACFATFEACKTAADADLAACKDALHACLPKEPGPGPHCGGPHGKGGPGGEHQGGGPKDCDGGRPGPPPPATSGDAPPPAPAGGPPPPDGPRPHGDADGGPPRGGEGHPDFCKKVPLPPSPELKACHDTLDTCISGGADRKVCMDADRACVKAAFDAAFQAACAATDKDERLTKLCAGGVAPGG